MTAVELIEYLKMSENSETDPDKKEKIKEVLDVIEGLYNQNQMMWRNEMQRLHHERVNLEEQLRQYGQTAYLESMRDEAIKHLRNCCRS